MNEQRTEQWYADRIGKFTASEIYKLMSYPNNKDNEFKATGMTYIYDKAAEILTGKPTTIFSPALDWGAEHELMARKFYQMETGNLVQDVGFVPYGEYAGGSPDGIVGELGMVEFKCPFNTTNHIKYMMMKTQDELPVEYFYQIQANLLFSGRKWCHFVSFDPRVVNQRFGIKIMTVTADEKAHAEIIKRIDAASKLLDNIIYELNHIERYESNTANV